MLFFFIVDDPKLLIIIPSTGALSATCFSSSKVFAFLATNVDSLENKISSIYG